VGHLTIEERFWSKVRIGDGCWEWTAALNHWGYGMIGLGGRRDGIERAHRLSAKWAGMDIEGSMVLHRCDNPKCVRPSHLFLGDAKANSQDMVGKGRALDGDRAPYAKLTQAQVDEIRVRREAGETTRKVAPDYEISQSMVSKISRGESWRQR
jgi:hypothetical protein